MAKLRVLLPFNGLNKKNLSNPFFRPYFADFRPKIGHFLHFFRFWTLFSLRGGSKKIFSPQFFFNSFYIPKWSQKKLFGNIICFRWIFIPILGKSEKSFHKSFLFKIEKCPKIPFTFARGKWCLSQKLSKTFHFLTIWTHMNPFSFSKNWSEFFPPLLKYSPGYKIKKVGHVTSGSAQGHKITKFRGQGTKSSIWNKSRKCLF